MTNRFKTAMMAFAFLAGSVSLAAAQDYRYYDRDGYYNSDRGNYGYDNYDRDDFYRGMQVARTIGHEDGEAQARDSFGEPIGSEQIAFGAAGNRPNNPDD